MKTNTREQTDLSKTAINNNNYGTIDIDQIEGSNNILLNLNDEELNKIYYKYIDSIKDVNMSIKASKFLSFISIISSFILLSIKLSDVGKFSWLYLNIPIIISILLLCCICNMYLYLNIIIDKAENNSSLNSKKAGTIFSYIVLYLITLCLIAFSISVTFYLQNVISQTKDAIFIFIPCFIAIILFLFYIVFISPAFTLDGLIMELGLIYINIISFSTFIILLVIKINNNLGHNKVNGLKYLFVFIPFYFAIGANIVYLILNKIIFDKKFTENNGLNNGSNNSISNSNSDLNMIYNINNKNNINFVLNLLSLLPLLAAGILSNLKLDEVISNKNHFVQSIIVMVSYLIFMSYSIYEIFTDNFNDNYENNNKNKI